MNLIYWKINTKKMSLKRNLSSSDNWLEDIYFSMDSSHTWDGCGICMGALDEEITIKTLSLIKEKKEGGFLTATWTKLNLRKCSGRNIYEMPKQIQDKALKLTFKEINKIQFKGGFINRGASSPYTDPFFSNKGNFIRTIVMLLDNYLERKELHLLLKKSLARVYLIRMENHYQRANRHFRN